jgi:hypothetical protein
MASLLRASVLFLPPRLRPRLKWELLYTHEMAVSLKQAAVEGAGWAIEPVRQLGVFERTCRAAHGEQHIPTSNTAAGLDVSTARDEPGMSSTDRLSPALPDASSLTSPAAACLGVMTKPQSTGTGGSFAGRQQQQQQTQRSVSVPRNGATQQRIVAAGLPMVEGLYVKVWHRVLAACKG